MTKGRRVQLLVLVALAIAAGIAVLFAIGGRTPPRTPEEFVPVTWKTAREAPMHVLHVGGKKIACTECHESMGTADGGMTGAVPTEASCAKCHEAEQKLGHHGGKEQAATTCLSCHIFGANKAAPRCNDCHAAATRAAGAPALEHHAGRDLPCQACHTVHGKERVVLADCTKCHDKTSATHGAFAAHPAAAPIVDGSTAMSLELDATVLAYVREAGAPVGPFSEHPQDVPARAIDPRTALPGHVCTACHAPHAGKEAARGTCEGCHVSAHRAGAAAPDAGASHRRAASLSLAALAPTVAPRGARVAGHEACVTCHEPHRARKADVRTCDGCHADHRTLATGHTTCTGCHSPHAPGEARSSCASCHANVATIGAARVPAHAACASCHDPHKPSASPGQACVGCHESTKPTHPAAKGGACIGCHAPHGGKGMVAARATPAHPAGARALGLPGTATSCVSCHTKAKDEHAFHAKGTTCTQCHAPHAFKLAGAGAQLCAKCHAGESTKVAARSGHQSCTACHGAPHAPIAKPACASCHAEETKTAPRGHSVCTSCHDAHSGARSARAATCTNCHEDKKAAQHANVPKSCASCHRAHGPNGVDKPAPCASCHARPSLPGLHSLGSHARCETCHTAHGPPRSDRATCTSTCHTDKQNHQPEAKVCKGCHLFGH